MDALMNSRAVAELLGVHPSTLCRMRLTGDGPPVVWVTPKSPRYLSSDVVAWIRSHRGGC